jgi:putative flavoprotein involved in K+ transport
MPFPAHPDHFPTKDEMADYLEAYAAHFELPVLTGVRVERLYKDGSGFVVESGERVFQANQIVVAMANHQKGQVPDFAKRLRSDIVQLHSIDYRRPTQLRPGSVLLVGAGNSSSELATELAKTHEVFVAGRDTGHLPFRVDGFWGRLLFVRLVLRVLFHRLLTINTPMGRKVRAKIKHHGGPLIRVKPAELRRLGVKRVPRVADVEGGLPKLQDGTLFTTDNVVWCTGFDAGFSWIDLDIFDDHGLPRHEAGVVPEAPGLYFVGLHFLYSMSSEMIHGVGRDAQRMASNVAAAAAAKRPPAADIALGRSAQSTYRGAELR